MVFAESPRAVNVQGKFRAGSSPVDFAVPEMLAFFPDFFFEMSNFIELQIRLGIGACTQQEYWDRL